MSATIYDVAKKAGVGIGTVSRVLNNSPKVSEATRQRVMAAMDALNYTPNPFARRLSTRKAFNLAVIAPFFTRSSSVDRLRGIEAVIAETEYDLVIYNVETPAKRDFYFENIIQRERLIDGVLIISFSLPDTVAERFCAAGIPIVLVDTGHPALSHVIVDDVEGGYAAASHLIALGHRRIAFVGDSF
jgi:DNA-binding LacI/PurR family transcriptional regulator